MVGGGEKLANLALGALIVLVAWLFGHIALIVPLFIVQLMDELWSIGQYNHWLFPFVETKPSQFTPLQWLLFVVNPLLGSLAVAGVVSFFLNRDGASGKEPGKRTVSEQESVTITKEEAHDLGFARSFLSDPTSPPLAFELGLVSLGFQKTAQSPRGAIFESKCAEVAFEWDGDAESGRIKRVGFDARLSRRKYLLMDAGVLLDLPNFSVEGA